MEAKELFAARVLHFITLDSASFNLETAINTHYFDTSPLILRWRESLKAYEEPTRHYHTLTHVRALMSFYLAHSSRDRITDIQFGLFSIFHDIVYDPKAAKGDNEKQSEALFQQFVKESKSQGDDPWLDESEISFVSQAILDTIDHNPSDPSSPLNGFFLDCDLSILSADPAEYDIYSSNI